MSFSIGDGDLEHKRTIEDAANILHPQPNTKSVSNSGRTYTLLRSGKVLGRKELLRTTSDKITQLSKELTGGKLNREDCEKWTKDLAVLKGFHAILIESKGVDPAFLSGSKTVGKVIGLGLALIFFPLKAAGKAISQQWVASRDEKLVKKWNKMPEAVRAHRELRRILSGKQDGSFIEKYKDMQANPEKYVVSAKLMDEFKKQSSDFDFEEPYLINLLKGGQESIQNSNLDQEGKDSLINLHLRLSSKFNEYLEHNRPNPILQFKSDLDSLLRQKDRAWTTFGSNAIQSSTSIIKDEFSKGDVSNIKFLAESGLFGRVSKKLLHQIIMSKLEESDRQEILESLFKNAQHPKDRERIIRLLMGTSKSVEASSLRRFMFMASTDISQGVQSRRDLAIRLIRDRYNEVSVEMKSTPAEPVAELKELRCLAALTADVDLIKKTIPETTLSDINAFLTTRPPGRGELPVSSNAQTLLGSQHDRRGKIFLHYLMEGARFVSSGHSKPEDSTEMVDLCTAVFFATKKGLPGIGNPFLAKDNKGIMPANSLNIALGNQFDARFSRLAEERVIARPIDGNQRGSMSNLAAYLQEQTIKPSLAMSFWCGMVGKMFGEIVSAHMVLGMPEGHIGLGQQILNASEMNAPVYSGFVIGALAAIPIQHIVNQARARNAGLKLSLEQYDDCEKSVEPGKATTTPKNLADPYFGNKYSGGSFKSNLDRAIRTRDVLALAILLKDKKIETTQLTQKQIKQLTKIHYFQSPDIREKIYDLIMKKALTAAAIERLIDNQLMQGASGVEEVRKLLNKQINEMETETQVDFQSPRFRACLAGAVTIGDRELIKKIGKMTKDKGPIFVSLQNRKGDTLLNLACRSNDVQVLKEVLLIMDQEFVKAQGAIKYSVKRSKQRIISMPSLKEFHVSFAAMGAKMSGERIVKSPFELLDGNGQTLLQSSSLTYELANRFDTDVSKMDIGDPNSLSFKKGLILTKQREQDAIEKSFLLPLKIAAGVPISNAIAIASGLAIGAATAPYGGIAAAPVIAGLVSYAMSVSVGTLQFMGMLLFSAALLSAGTEAFHSAENYLRGNESRFTAFGSDPGALLESLTQHTQTPNTEANEAAKNWFETYQSAVKNSLESIGVIKSADPNFEYRGKNITQELNKIKTALDQGSLDPARAYLRVERLIANLDIPGSARVSYTHNFLANYVSAPESQGGDLFAIQCLSGRVVTSATA